MADYNPGTSITAGADAIKGEGTSGAAITQGRAVYQATDGTYSMADSNTQTKSAAAGIALNGCAAAGQPITFAKGTLNGAATAVVGETYVLADTPDSGLLMPVGDILVGDFIGGLYVYASAATVLHVLSGVATPVARA